jgi:hypothetical protein
MKKGNKNHVSTCNAFKGAVKPFFLIFSVTRKYKRRAEQRGGEEEGKDLKSIQPQTARYPATVFVSTSKI